MKTKRKARHFQKVLATNYKILTVLTSKKQTTKLRINIKESITVITVEVRTRAVNKSNCIILIIKGETRVSIMNSSILFG